jgi:hypothetical protein
VVLIRVVAALGGTAAIGALEDAAALLAGTTVRPRLAGAAA